MNFLKKKSKLRDVATLTTATVATLTLATTNPASAALFKIGFCGFFEGDTEQSPVGQTLPGSYITINTDKTENFGIVDAKITTARPVAGQNELTYTLSLLQGSGKGISFQSPNPEIFNGSGSTVESVYWRFFDGQNQTGNNFNVVIPTSIFDNLSGSIGNIELADNSEIRANGGGSKECDARTNYCGGQNPPPTRPGNAVIIPIPEPTGVLGTAIAISLGGLMTKRNLSKLKKDKEAA